MRTGGRVTVSDMPAAAVYARISSDPNETALGVTRQLQDCLALAEKKGWPVVETYVDNDVSATSGKMRPQYTRMMQELATGRLGALVVWDVDRLTRTPRELEDVVDLAEQCGVALASVGGEIDLATPQGRLTARIKGSVAKHETEQLTRRIKRKIAERAEAGAPHGRKAYGWRREEIRDEQGRRIGSRDVLDPEQAEVVRQAALAILSGESVRGLAHSLNAAGSVSLNGKPWSNITLRRVLLRDRNAGLRVHQGKVVGRGDWEPLYDEDTHRRVVATLTAPGRRIGPPTSAIKYLLSGLAVCGVCGQPLRVLLAGKDRTSDSYICKNGYHVRRQMKPLDDLVTKVVIGRLSQPDAVDLFRRDDDEEGRQAREQADAIRARLDLAADAFAEGDIDGAQLKRITGKLRPELERLERVERAASTAPDMTDLAAPDIAERWDSLPLARKRAVIDLLITVTVHLSTARGGAAARFDPRTVEITWRTS